MGNRHSTLINSLKGGLYLETAVHLHVEATRIPLQIMHKYFETRKISRPLSGFSSGLEQASAGACVGVTDHNSALHRSSNL